MDIGTIIGIVSGVGLIVIALSNTGSLSTYWDPASLMITIGGTMAGTLINYPIDQIVGVLKVVRNVFQRRLPLPEAMIERLVYFTEKARREGILALEDEVEALDDDFLKKVCSWWWMVVIPNWCVISWRQNWPLSKSATKVAKGYSLPWVLWLLLSV